ncbi:beta-1,3-galactosyltransferase 1-like [Amphibalanus amphitrite]|uniref:beta-1,3-galactosyltransferase 1-like n=1 Tax=Amphibalanus amphitrite TaxID=1232801 RepID=UPI001C91630C|nr:beta-1,3-galactosyltransferase 1-like [Amphibalanus amphitrite]
MLCRRPPLPLLLLLLDAALSEEKCQPVFDVCESAPSANTHFLSKNNTQVVASPGETVLLPCQLQKPSDYKVSWLFKATRRLLTVQDWTFTQDDRLSARLNTFTNTWNLKITNVSVEDSGIYECQVSAHPWDRLQVRLKISDPDGSNRRTEHVPLVRDYGEPGFHLENSALCPDGGQNVKLVILVQSALQNSNQRSVIRHTWARPANFRDDIVMGFVVARTDDPALQKGVEYEQSLYGDIIQANFVDHYNNLTLKTLASLEWFDVHCGAAKFVLKVDDDVFLNIRNLESFIDEHRDARRTIFGNVIYNPMPNRDKESRYYVSPKIWEKTKYPRYTSGPLYLVTGDSVRELRQRVLERPYFFIEDVTVTGIGAKMAAVRRVRAPEFFTYPVPLTDTCLYRMLVGAHQVPAKEMSALWNRVVDKTLKCPYTYEPKHWKPCTKLKAQESLKHCVLTLFTAPKNG